MAGMFLYGFWDLRDTIHDDLLWLLLEGLDSPDLPQKAKESLACAIGIAYSRTSSSSLRSKIYDTFWAIHLEVRFIAKEVVEHVHSTEQYENNRAEVSHQPTRQRERQMRRFKSPGQAQRFLSVHGVIQNLFRVVRHLLGAAHHRELRGRAFLVWHEAKCA